MGRQHGQGFDTVLGRVKQEMKRSVDKYGPLSRDPHRALAVIVKELGEVAEAVNDVTRFREQVPSHIKDGLKSELAQVTQLCMQFIMNIEEAEALPQRPPIIPRRTRP